METGVALAKAQALRVLSARPTDTEAQFSFGALVDLLDEVDTNALKELPAPQRHALDVALLRIRSPDARAAGADRTTSPAVLRWAARVGL